MTVRKPRLRAAAPTLEAASRDIVVDVIRSQRDDWRATVYAQEAELAKLEARLSSLIAMDSPTRTRELRREMRRLRSDYRRLRRLTCRLLILSQTAREWQADGRNPETPGNYRLLLRNIRRVEGRLRELVGLATQP